MTGALALLGAALGVGALGLALALSVHPGFALRVGAALAGRAGALLAGEVGRAEADQLLGLARRLRRPALILLVTWFAVAGALIELGRRPLP